MVRNVRKIARLRRQFDQTSPVGVADTSCVTTERQYLFPVRSARVVDGDTYWMGVDLGFNASLLVEIRLDGWDTPEKKSMPGRVVGPRERAAAARATALSTAWMKGHLDAGHPIWVATQPDPEKYGRWLGKVSVHLPDGTTEELGEALHQQDLATVWPTRWWQTHPEAGSTGASSLGNPQEPSEPRLL